MKFLVATLLVFITSLVSYGQQRKLTRSESANMTQEQRIVHETERKKKKGGKKKSKRVSMKKRVKVDKKQDKKARRVKSPKPTHGKKGPR
jgi:hypothetical protein